MKDYDHGAAKVVILFDQKNTDSFFKKFVDDHLDAIFVINGFRSRTTQYFKKFIFQL